jgi:hypothetical protein
MVSLTQGEKVSQDGADEARERTAAGRMREASRQDSPVPPVPCPVVFGEQSPNQLMNVSVSLAFLVTVSRLLTMNQLL